MWSSGEVWDVVVVGAGPAGAATAARLARAGHRVLLVDRDAFPRPKPCGECVSPAAVERLEALGALPAVLRARPAPLSRWRIRAPDGCAFDGCFPPGRDGLALPRTTFDRLLLEHARDCGAHVATGVRVVDVLRRGGVAGVRVRTSAGVHRDLAARLTVGADGLRSVVARRLGLIRRLPRLRKVALTAHVRELPTPPATGELRVTGFGCIGIADVGDGTANVTVVVAGAGLTRLAGRRAAFFDQALRDAGLGAAERVAPVLATGPFDWPVRRAFVDGALLVGDAAGYYDPFTGKGIYRALHGAELASAAADRALRLDDCSARRLADYDAARRRAFAAGERLQRLIEAVVSRPRLLAPAVRLLARRPRPADALVAVAADLCPARTLLHPAVLAGLAC